MELIQTTQYLRTKKHLIKQHAISKVEVESALDLFKEDPYHISLHYKKMTCKKDKERYSIRIPHTQYRILMNISPNTAYLVCVCSHDEYDRRNRGC